MENIILNIKNKIKDDIVVVACSTGVDSCVLLNLCMKALNKEQIVIAHVNHGVRVESNREEEYIRAFSAEHNLKLEVERLVFQDLSNFESVARKKRYDFFQSVASSHNAKYILLAHHANDNLETVLMRLIKQSSLKGYAGIEEETYFKNFVLFRPLIKISRLEIEEYANNNNIKYFDDSTNLEYDHMRNRIRLEVVPLLLKENPNLIEAVNYYSESLLGAASLLEESVEYFIKSNVYISDKVISFNIGDFLRCSDYLQKEVLFSLLKPYSFSRALINELIRIISNNKTKVVNELCKDLTLVKEYGKCLFVKEENESKDFFLKVDAIGTYKLLNDGLLEVNKNNCYYKAGKRVVCYNMLSAPFTVRTRCDGDKIKRKRINKNTGEVTYYTQKVSDVLTNKKIPYLDRLNTLVVVNEDNEVIIILGLTIS